MAIGYLKGGEEGLQLKVVQVAAGAKQRTVTEPNRVGVRRNKVS